MQLQAILHAFPGIRQVYAWDQDPAIAGTFATRMSAQCGVPVGECADLHQAAGNSDIIITCTPSRGYFLRQEDVRPGTFISAVGADSPGKQELEPLLVSSSKVVVDILEQCVRVGELQHALAEKRMSIEGVYAELSTLVAGQMPGRTSPTEIILFDTTGSAIQDTAAAVAVYEKAQALGRGQWVDLFS